MAAWRVRRLHVIGGLVCGLLRHLESMRRPEVTPERKANFARHAHWQFLHEHLPAIRAAGAEAGGDDVARDVALLEEMIERRLCAA
ncbi:MAG: hypothetical protein NVV74_07275 [Magnetospirillum sp.]|nr:hypothetical protein [Magnetospirillum sp.]